MKTKVSVYLVAVVAVVALAAVFVWALAWPQPTAAEVAQPLAPAVCAS
jgi:hypothetical protein